MKMLNKKATMAMSQIMILVMGIVAFGFLVGEMRVVRGLGLGKGALIDPDSSGFGLGSDVSLPSASVTPAKAKSSPKVTASSPGSGTDLSWKNQEELPSEWDPGEGPNTGEWDEWDGSPAKSFRPGITDFGKNLWKGFMAASIAAMFIQMIAPILGHDTKETQAMTAAAFGGIMTGTLAYSTVDWIQYGKNPTAVQWHAAGWGIGVGLTVAFLILWQTYATEDQEIVTFDCYSWQPPKGGQYCTRCNNLGVPCSEYMCRSLGQACQLLNPGTGKERCAWVNRHDVKVPEIKPWDIALSPGYEYTPDKTISPPDYGVKIVNKNPGAKSECVPPFFPLSFGVTTNELAQCKIDYLRKKDYDSLDFFFGGSQLYLYNHTQVMSLPGPSAFEAENLTISNDGQYNLHVKCEDFNGNSNPANFVFRYCVDQGPDTTPPLIVTTDLLNEMPVSYNQTELDLKVYTNEPAECRWSHDDVIYNRSENQMACSTSVTEVNAQMLYECSTTLTGIENGEENKFYFRCKDQPTGIDEQDRNINAESYEYIVYGTEPLVIDSVEPDGKLVKGSTESVQVTLEAKTSAGYREGESLCYYSDSREPDSYVLFYMTNSYEHFQDLYFTTGNYKYYIRCVDLGGNSDETEIEFEVESDASAPIIVRAYHETPNIKIVTAEPATCVYSETSCSYLFEDGIAMTSLNEIQHFTDWNIDKTYYIKCEDSYNNRPDPDKCSMTIKAWEI